MEEKAGLGTDEAELARLLGAKGARLVVDMMHAFGRGDVAGVQRAFAGVRALQDVELPQHERGNTTC